MTIETYISIITLNVNGLNVPKGHRLAEWLQETHFRPQDTYKKWEDEKKIYSMQMGSKRMLK